MKKMHPAFEMRMMWKEYTGLPMNVAIDDGYAYDFQQLPFKQVAFQMDTDENLNKDNWNAMGNVRGDCPHVETLGTGVVSVSNFEACR